MGGHEIWEPRMGVNGRDTCEGGKLESVSKNWEKSPEASGLGRNRDWKQLGNLKPTHEGRTRKGIETTWTIRRLIPVNVNNVIECPQQTKRYEMERQRVVKMDNLYRMRRL